MLIAVRSAPSATESIPHAGHGEIAALSTSLCFAFGSTLFTLAGREIGAQRVNRARLLLAALLIALVHWLTFGRLSLVAVQRTSVGIASTLTSLTPMFLIPISYVAFRERVTVQAVVGTLIAFAGTVLPFL